MCSQSSGSSPNDSDWLKINVRTSVVGFSDLIVGTGLGGRGTSNNVNVLEMCFPGATVVLCMSREEKTQIFGRAGDRNAKSFRIFLVRHCETLVR